MSRRGRRGCSLACKSCASLVTESAPVWKGEGFFAYVLPRDMQSARFGAAVAEFPPRTPSKLRDEDGHPAAAAVAVPG